MAQKIEFCKWCKADFKDKANWCSKCYEFKPSNKRKKKKDQEGQMEFLK